MKYSCTTTPPSNMPNCITATSRIFIRYNIILCPLYFIDLHWFASPTSTRVSILTYFSSQYGIPVLTQKINRKHKNTVSKCKELTHDFPWEEIPRKVKPTGPTWCKASPVMNVPGNVWIILLTQWYTFLISVSEILQENSSPLDSFPEKNEAFYLQLFGSFIMV